MTGFSGLGALCFGPLLGLTCTAGHQERATVRLFVSVELGSWGEEVPPVRDMKGLEKSYGKDKLVFDTMCFNGD